MSEELTRNAQRWLNDLEAALATKDAALLAELFQETSYLRDNVALTWDYRQAHNREQIQQILWAAADTVKPSNLRFSERWSTPSVVAPAGSDIVEIVFEFDTVSGQGTGLLRALPNESSAYGFDGFSLYTRLESLHGFEHPEDHPRGHGFTPNHPKENWQQHREARKEFSDREPQVLVVGGGHSGQIVSAHLKRLGVETLIVDKFERVGDNWRKRYHSLALHNPIEMNHLPFLDYPKSWPQYLPKDMLANWLEIYSEVEDLNIWTSTAFLGGEYDESTRTWTAKVRRGDGSERTLHPKHIVIATGGVGGDPHIPELRGLSEFKGTVIHSTQFTSGQDYAGKKAIVVGVGTSAHDIALDLYNNDADVTMIQRSPTVVASVDCANMAYGAYFEEDADPDLIDLQFSADFVHPLLIEGAKAYQQAIAQIDAPLHKRLEEAGLRLEEGEDGTGWLVKFLRYGGGYYLNVGASDVIADGGIKIEQDENLDGYGPDGAKRKDGSTLEADVIVLATGFQDRHSELTRYFGAEMADKIGQVGGFGEEGELANDWKPTPQPGLWFSVGSMQQTRCNGPLLAYQIKGDLENLVPASLKK